MAENSKGKRIIFVGGSPRSGTTMMQNILDSHPMIAGGPEFDRIPDIIELRNRLHQSVASGRIDVFVSSDDIDAGICQLIENLLHPFADSHKKEFISEKTPANVLVFSELLKICPEAKFIFVVRDPRAVIASMLEVGKRAKEKKITPPEFTAGVSGAVSYVKSCLNAGFESMGQANGRVFLVVYEELVKEPEKNTRRICDFLGIEWNRDMMSPGERNHKGEKGIDGVWYDKKMYSRNIEKADIDKWKMTLSLYQIMKINDEFRDWKSLEILGYDFSNNENSTIKRLVSRLSLGSVAIIEKTTMYLIRGVVGIKPLYAILTYFLRMAKQISRNHAKYS